MTRWSWMVVACLCWATPALAQPVVGDVYARRVYLGEAGANQPLRAAAGSPEGVVTAVAGVQYLNVTDGTWWRKETGSGNTGWVPVTMITWTGTTSTVKSPSFVRNNATSVSAGQGIGYWMQLAPSSGGSCNTANPAANDFVAYYACMESVSGRDTATHGAGKGLWGTNFVLTVNAGFNFSAIGHETDIQNISGEGTSVPAAFASNGKVGYGAVLASTASTDGDGSAGFATHVGGTDLNDLWKYGFEAYGARTAAFYSRKSGNLGDQNPTSVLLAETDATNFLETTGTHTMVLDSSFVKLYGSSGGRIGIHGSEPVLDFYESDQAADGKFWRFDVGGGTFNLQTVNDAYSSASSLLSMTRAGFMTIGSGTPRVTFNQASPGTLASPTTGFAASNVNLMLHSDTAVGTRMQTFRAATGGGAVGSASTLFNWVNYGWDGASWIAAAAFSVATDATVSTGIVPAGFNFTTMNSAGVGAVRAKITSTGHFLPGADNSYDIGAETDRFRTLNAMELLVQTLTAKEVISTIGGNIVVAPTTILTADLAAAGTTITLKHNNLANGDRIVMKGIGKTEWMLVTSGAGGSAGAYTYTVTRDADGSGANDWYTGDAVMNSGTTGDGFINLYSEQEILINGAGIGPAITGYVRTGTDWNQLAPRWTIGNLNGNYGYVADTYGAAFGDNLNAWIKIDSTNGIRIGHNATTKIALTAAGDASFSGEITAASGLIGGWEIGATYLRAAADDVGISSAVTGGDDIRFWAGDSTMASAEFRVTESGALTATNATITGTVTASAGSIGGCTIAATSITCGSGFSVSDAGVITGTAGAIGGFSLGSDYIRDAGNSFGLASTVTGGTDVRFWAGDTFANRATAPFYVNEGGFLHAESAEFGSGSASVNVDSSGLVVNGSGRIEAGSGDVVIDNNGVTLAGGGPTGFVNWSAGSYVGDPTGTGALAATSVTFLSLTAGTDAYLTIGGTATTTSAAYPLVSTATDGSAPLRYKTDGYNGTQACPGGQWIDSLTTEYGIVISSTCAAFTVPGLDALRSAVAQQGPAIATLRAEVNELRQLVLALIGGRTQ